MVASRILFTLGVVCTLSAGAAASCSAGPVTIADAVEMTRIQGIEGDNSPVASFSPDGRRFVAVVYHGDLVHNVNVYRMLRFDKTASGKWSGPRTLLTVSFDASRKVEDREDPRASPVDAFQFLSDNRTVAFIGTFDGQPRAVYALDTNTRMLRQLTHTQRDVTGFGLSGGGNLRYYAVSFSSTPGDVANGERWVRSGVSVMQSRGPTLGSAWGLAVQQTLRFTDERSPWYAARSPGSRWFCIAPNGRSIRMPVPLLPRVWTPIVQVAAVQPEGNLAAVAVLAVDGTKIPLHFEDQLSVIDLRTGQRIRSLVLPNPHGYEPVWAPDGRSFLIGPIAVPGDRGVAYREIRLDGSTSSFKVPDIYWSLQGWSDGRTIVFVHTRSKAIPTDFNTLGFIRRTGSNWGTFENAGASANFDLNQRYQSVLSGTTMLGVRDGLTTAPELAAYDLVSHKTTVLTDLNPALRNRTFAEVSRIFWKGADGSDGHFGYLIKPVGYTAGRRYPLVVLMKDEGYDSTDDSFLIDGQEQLSAFAAQTLANAGVVVLLTPDPLSGSQDGETPREAPGVLAHVESAVAYLDGLGIIDPERIAISGWSRNAMYTDYMIAHSKIKFAAASDVDGGGNYRLFMLDDRLADPHDLLPDHDVDLHLRDIHTPLMSEEHGLPSLLYQVSLIGDLESLHKPVELYYYPNAPHNLRTPLDRYASLSRNTDWFRFWLQCYEDPNPSKAPQYTYWRELRALNDADASTK